MTTEALREIPAKLIMVKCVKIIPVYEHVASRSDCSLDKVYSRLEMPHQVLIGHIQHIDNHVLKLLKKIFRRNNLPQGRKAENQLLPAICE
jgi:hypothetical protein